MNYNNYFLKYFKSISYYQNNYMVMFLIVVVLDSLQCKAQNMSML